MGNMFNFGQIFALSFIILKAFYTKTLENNGIMLFDEESVIKHYTNVVWNDPDSCLLRGTLLMTSERVIFLPDQENANSFHVLYCHTKSVLTSLENNTYKINQDLKPVIILSKIYSFYIIYTNMHRASVISGANGGEIDVQKDIYETLLSNCFYDKSHILDHCLAVSESSSWESPVIGDEFERLQVDTQHWSLSTFNSDYSLCETYPSQLILPSKFSRDQILQISNGHDDFRLPVLVWRSPKNFILTCSNLNNEQTKLNSEYFDAIIDTLPEKSILQYIFLNQDTKVANSLQLGQKVGQSRPVFFPNLFPNIDLINAQIQLFDYIVEHRPTEYSISAGLLELPWFGYVSKTMEVITQLGEEASELNFSFLLIGDSRYNHTPVISSLLQLVLDPYYRTFEGFYVILFI